MNICFHNLGKIKETELDLKPMTVIIGPNNSNKTYIAYSVYGLWHSLGNGVYPDPPRMEADGHGSLYVNVEVLYKAFVVQNRRTIDEFVNDLDSFYQNSSRALFASTQYEVIVSPEEFRTAIEALSGTILDAYASGKYLVSIELDSLVLSPANEVESTINGPRLRGASHFEAARAMNVALRQKLFSVPYLLPAERNAFVITYKVLAKNRLKLVLDAQRRSFSSRQNSERQLGLLKEAGEVRYP